MNEFDLKYFKDTDGRYILKRSVSDVDEEMTGYILHTGTSSCNLILSTNNFEKKLQHKLDDLVCEIENFAKNENKITEEDILSEKIVAKIQDEKEFNPIFRFFSPEEIEQYTKHSKKVRVNIDFEFHIKTRKYLVWKTFLKKLHIDY